MKKTLLAILIFALAATTHAALVLDQHQDRIDPGSTVAGYLVGSDSEYMLGQTVTAGITGRLARIEISAVCESGRLDVEIRNVVDIFSGGIQPIPGPTVLGRGSSDASEFPLPGVDVFRPIDLDRSVRMSAGDRFAIVLRNDTGRCFVGSAWTVDLYSGGRGVWRYSGTAPDGWLGLAGLGDDPGIDIAFRTYVETGSGRRVGFTPCQVSGFRPLPFPSFVPLCRCLEDPSLRETRCGFLHPSLFLTRTIPSPLIANKPFDVKWTLFALAPLDGVIEVDDVLPPGFLDAKSPLVFFGEQIPVGETLTLSYEAVAGPKAGSFKTDSIIAISGDQKEADVGSMRSVIEVAPK